MTTPLHGMAHASRTDGFGIADYEIREGEIARRNVLFGLWAGRRLGLADADLEAYAWSVHLADREVPGQDDVIAKVSADFAAHGVDITESRLRRHLHEMRLRASLDLAQP
ncbi:ATPase inhibitor subunit zeta [Blastochloris sulfoviridis]|uniref:DUF1476 family protein n=1 Tax=Blastochloris sulfoviridis TaxID=50712 RepID=A0A5M6HMT7_9HYPH|nr:ATPase inhibitor subunit zeta [Blastochloris sulfoviridis]KAA5597172.1 DUF1476 family protein [Blastochloris sulfoviridis]